ncbi:MAG TPA: glutamine amidotransferase [Candidatus Saccharimonas sp.]|nr:glutamine amidotransferase [Candidatus Saccharimonas sp.]
MSKGVINIAYLYPREMNIYGDWGNVLTLQRRLEWHGYEPKILEHNVGGAFPKNADIIVGGGGQDSGQLLVEADLRRHGETLKKMATDGTPMLMICGLYQLFGRFFKTADGTSIKGIGLFNLETHATNTRIIGNVIIDTPFGDIIGYENHSGKTILDAGQQPFGKVKKGGGNNGDDGTEGAIVHNVYGTYMHGSLLPKNPEFADALIEKAVVNRYGSFDPNVIDDTFATRARIVATERPR